MAKMWVEQGGEKQREIDFFFKLICFEKKRKCACACGCASA